MCNDYSRNTLLQRTCSKLLSLVETRPQILQAVDACFGRNMVAELKDARQGGWPALIPASGQQLLLARLMPASVQSSVSNQKVVEAGIGGAIGAAMVGQLNVVPFKITGCASATERLAECWSCISVGLYVADSMAYSTCSCRQHSSGLLHTK